MCNHKHAIFAIIVLAVAANLAGTSAAAQDSIRDRYEVIGLLPADSQTIFVGTLNLTDAVHGTMTATAKDPDSAAKLMQVAQRFC